MGWLSSPSRTDKRGRWSDVLKGLSLVAVLYLGLRWLTIEPYVIPSGSMKPTLLIQDYVLVHKWSYGLRLPFSKTWLWGPKVPRRGDVVVFRSVSDRGHFMVKRVVGLPGETIAVDAEGFVSVDGKPLEYSDGDGSDEFRHFKENLKGVLHPVQLSLDEEDRTPSKVKVPAGELFVMGDNRDQSMDSRYWGTLPLGNLLGRASLIWMSCKDNDKVSSFLCDPEFFRKERIFMRIR